MTHRRQRSAQRVTPQLPWGNVDERRISAAVAARGSRSFLDDTTSGHVTANPLQTHASLGHAGGDA